MFSVFDRQRPQAERQVPFLVAVVRHTEAAVAVAGAIGLWTGTIDNFFWRHKHKIKMKN